MKLIGSYINGNYKCSIYSDGTKIRENNLDTLIPDTVESLDLKITNKCDMGCKFCHEDSTPEGIHGDILSDSFLNRLHPCTEIAIGGGNPLCHPDLVEFLQICKKKRLIPSITVNQTHFVKSFTFIKSLVDRELIFGIGVSLNNVNDEFIKLAKQLPNVVIHVINGVVHMSEIEALAGNDLKILILGYKEVRRGLDNYKDVGKAIEARKEQLKSILPSLLEDKSFKVMSFDNLAVEQLDVKSILPEKDWEEFYMGGDGEFTMYVDMVKRQFAKNSCASETDRYDLLPTIEEMFNFIREHK